MNDMIKSLMGMGGMTDQVIATDFLISAKAGVRNIAFAIAECATPEMKEGLRGQLKEAIEIHEEISNYMIEKGYYRPHDLDEQLKVDMDISNTALRLVGE